MAYLSGVSRAQTGSFVDVKLDERAMARAQKRISAYEGQKFRQRMERVFRAGAQLLVSPTRRAIRSSVRGHGKNPGMLAGKVSVRKGRPPSGYFVRFGTKSRAPHSHLVNAGHRKYDFHGHPTGGFVAGYGFYESVIQSYEGKVIDFINRNTIDDGVTAAPLTSAIRSF